MSFFMKPKKKALRKVALVAAVLFIASVALGAGIGALDFLGGEPQHQVNIEQEKEQLAHFEEEVKENSEDVGALMNLGQQQLFLGMIYAEQENDLEKAETYFEKSQETYDDAIELDPENVDLLVDKASAAFYLNEVEKAEGLLSEALEIEPEHNEALYMYSNYLAYIEADFEAAIEKLETALDSKDLTDHNREQYEMMIEQYEVMNESTEENIEQQLDVEEEQEDQE
ncbi:tetratricopeptide repeat protein [Natranaerobius trueperi]|uniref:Uncharacterized protein n=1 Tax=Natranaerobius trueperi TaxID=759412 RepID=A0A226C2S6_9FIRM|nr:tetratricopeptide repeat protein [Natranaerobius trueperi]OWZ84749.1 hypothetical protein CDO51_01645 [Natranaerobius trueperi]